MSAVRLSRRLRLEELVPSPDGAGGLTQIWEEAGALWADLRAARARGPLREGGVFGGAGLQVVVRFAPPGSPQRPAPGQRFREGARVWLILAVSEGDPDARYLSCQVREEGAP